MSDILNKILAVKAQEVAAAQAIKPLAMMRDEAGAGRASTRFRRCYTRQDCGKPSRRDR